MFFNFTNLTLKWWVVTYMGGDARRWWVNSFFTLSVILRTLVYFIIWSTLHKIP